MNNKEFQRAPFLFGFIAVFVGLCVVVFIYIRILLNREPLEAFWTNPENVSNRTLASTQNFTLLWTKQSEDGNQHITYTQIFAPDEEIIVYASINALTALDWFSSEIKWSIKTPQNAIFHFYKDRLYSLATYDATVPFAPQTNISIPSQCNSSEISTLHVFDPHTGEHMWAYSYRMTRPDQIYFIDDSAFISGLTIGVASKFISEFEIDIESGSVLGVVCRDYNTISNSPTTRTVGTLSSGIWPVIDDWEWKLNDGMPAFITTGDELKMFDRENRELLGAIEFAGAQLNPYDMQLIIRNDLLFV